MMKRMPLPTHSTPCVDWFETSLIFAATNLCMLTAPKFSTPNITVFFVLFHSILCSYKPIVAKVMEIFRPGAVVLQCGADSLYGDRLGFFNLSFRGHGRCVQFMRE